jgi:hypothetical protein
MEKTGNGLTGVIALFGALALLILGQGEAGAAKTLGLSYSSPLGALALHAAIEQGYFKEEGLEVTPVKAAAGDIPGLLADGRIVGGELDHGIHTLLGKGIGVTAGLCSGFLELLGKPPKGSPGEVVLVSENVASGPAVAAARQLKAMGLDTVGSVRWLAAPKEGLLSVLERGDATLLARWEKAIPGTGHGHEKEPGHGHGGSGGGGEGFGKHAHAGTEAHAGHEANGDPSRPEDAVPVVFSARASLPHDDGAEASANPHAKHTSAHHFFDSFVFVGRDFHEKNPETAAAVTRAWIRGAMWVGGNKGAAADLGLSHSLWPGDRESLLSEIDSYMWMPGVRHAKEHLRVYIHEWVARGLFPAGTDEGVLFESLFIQALPDVN